MNLSAFFSADARNYRPSAIRALAKIIGDPQIISFAGGVPNPATFPSQKLAEIAASVLRDQPSVSLQYGPTEGIVRLRDFIAGMCGERGFSCSSDDVLTTTGSQQALDLVAHTLLDPGDVVLVELPTYIGGTASFFARSATLQGVEQDDEGIVPESLDRVAGETSPKLLYTIPNFQNPSGRLMTQARRERVLELASKHNFLIIEDDPYGELVYTRDADTTPMKKNDGEGRVIYCGSFSKVLAPGLRCGWIVAGRELLTRLAMAKQAADLCSGMLDQSIVDLFCAAGELAPQITRIRAFYQESRTVLLDSLTQHFTGRAHWTPAEGGLFTFVTLNQEIDTAAMLPKALEYGVAYVPGAPFFVNGSGSRTMRLTFAKESPDRLREGIERLAAIFQPDYS